MYSSLPLSYYNIYALACLLICILQSAKGRDSFWVLFVVVVWLAVVVLADPTHGLWDLSS